MRIRRLDLKAFGPFSDLVLDFSTERPGLHIVYGPNEAGKSSCLRALKALFFGIPTRTGDSFLHPYDQLMVGGSLCAEDGREVTFYRRKKRKADLFDQNDDPLDAKLLAPFLQWLEPDLFDSLYGIDHEALVRGGQEILNQKGDVGQAIFAAGVGITSLKSVLDELENEGDELFRPRGSTKAINETLFGYRDLQEQAKKALLSSQEWQEHRRVLQKAEKELKETVALRAEKDRGKRRLERLNLALPYLGQRKMVLEKLAELGDVVLLPPGFSESRTKLERERSEAVRDADAAISRLRDLRKRKEEISPQLELVHRADEIEEMYQRLGQHRKAMADRPRLDGIRIGHKTEAATLLKQIRPDLTLDRVETLRSGLAKKKTIQILGNRYEALIQTIGKAEREVQKQEEEIKTDREALSRLVVGPDPHTLIQILKRVQKAGDMDEDLRQRRRALDSLRETTGRLLDQLGLWGGHLDEAGKLSVPMLETVNWFEQEIESLNQKRDRLRTEKGELDAELRRLLTQLHEIQYGGGVPTEEELLKVRSSRDLGWGLLKRQWVDGEDVAEEAGAFSPDSPLPETYENLVGLSDQTADRLRREADRVQKQASLKSQEEGVEDRRVDLDREIGQLDADIGDAENRWHELWSDCGIRPLSPREMRQWLSEFERIRYQIEESDKAARETAARERVRQELRDALIAEMRGIGDSHEFAGLDMTPVQVHAEALVESIRDDQARRETLEAKIREGLVSLKSLLHERRTAQDDMKRWQDAWKDALTPLGLDSGTRPEEALEYIETLKDCFDKLKEADEFKIRIDGIDRDRQEFRNEVENLATQIAPDLRDQEAYQAVSVLQARLNKAREEKALLQQYLEEIDTLEKKLLQNQTSLKDIKKRMASLLQTAGCEKEEELDEAELRSNEHMTLKEKLAEVESHLAKIAAGVSFSELEDQARDVDPNSLLGEIEKLSHEIENRLDGEIRQLSETIGQEKSQLARMDGTGRAAELADESQNVLARLRRLSEQFIRVKLASRILRDVIERYRLEHQDPVLKLASRYFKDITLGSFIALRTDVDDHGQAVLIGVRPSGAWVNVEGMSDGTRDQLYLALRLATLEWRLESSEPVPFTVDDVLINFDDDRARATLKVMAKLAERNQIILFTHHRRIVDTALKMDAGQRVFIHQI